MIANGPTPIPRYSLSSAIHHPLTTQAHPPDVHGYGVHQHHHHPRYPAKETQIGLAARSTPAPRRRGQCATAPPPPRDAAEMQQQLHRENNPVHLQPSSSSTKPTLFSPTTMVAVSLVAVWCTGLGTRHEHSVHPSCKDKDSPPTGPDVLHVGPGLDQRSKLSCYATRHRLAPSANIARLRAFIA